jgi:hypothetical protein
MKSRQHWGRLYCFYGSVEHTVIRPSEAQHSGP